MREQQIRFVTTPDGVRVACATAGSGPPLVKAPNWLSHAEFDWHSPIWRHWWEELSRDRCFIRFDQRGCGLSDRSVENLSFDAWVGDLESVVDALHLDRFALLGMSQGGAVAVEYAVRHPERVSHLVLHGAFARGWARRGDSPREYSALLALIREGWGRDNPAYRQIFTSQFIPEGTAEQMDWFNELERVSASPDGAVRFQVEVGKIDVLDRLPHVATPTLIFHGRRDARVPFDQGRQLAALIPGAQFVPLESRNHILLDHEPAWPVFLSEFRSFLGAPPAIPSTPPLAEAEPAKLTRREVEVLTFVAAGKTDREIAAELVVSVRTVGNHVANILDKTGCANRTEAAVYATRVGLI